MSNEMASGTAWAVGAKTTFALGSMNLEIHDAAKGSFATAFLDLHMLCRARCRKERQLLLWSGLRSLGRGLVSNRPRNRESASRAIGIAHIGPVHLAADRWRS